MMKKYFYSMLAAGMLLATSCSEDELVDVTKGEGEKVTFKVELPGTQSRAINEDGDKVGDGIYADRLVYAMYEEDQNDVLITGFADRDEETKTFTVTVPMAKDIKYDLLFIAYDDENCAFKIDNTTAANNNLKALQLKSVLTANTDQYDAFVGFLDSQGITAEGTTTVPLKRPFAQVNVGTKLQDLEDIKKLKSQVVTSDFKIYNVPNTLNIFTGEVFGSQELSFTAADILTQYGVEEYPNYETIPNLTYEVDGEEKSYYCLAMSYVLAGQTSSTHDADFRFYRKDGKQVSSIDVVSMPIQANYRTNVVGTILTQVEQYEITISEMFADQYHEAEPAGKVVVNTLTDLQDAINAATEPTVIEIGGDMTYGQSRSTNEDHITIPANSEITIDLNGYTITGVDNTEKNYGLIQNNGTLTIKDTSKEQKGKMSLSATSNSGTDRYSAVISNNPGGTLTINGGTFEHTGGTYMAYGIDMLTNGGIGDVNTTVNSGTIKSTYRGIRQFLNSDSKQNNLTINGGTIEGTDKSLFFHDPSTKANNGKLIVGSDAEIKNDVYLFVTENSTEWPVEVSIAASALVDNAAITSKNVPDGYIIIENDGVWNVVNLNAEDGSYEIANLATLKWFRDQVNAGNSFDNKIIKLTADIDLNDEQWSPISYFQDDKNDGKKRFAGTFDGDNHTISNLKYHSTEDDWYVGLFGCTRNATIKNLTICNVDMNLNKGLHFAALIGDAAGYTTIENITISGDVKIVGDINNEEVGRIGCIVGGNSGTFILRNITIDANEGSYVEGNSSIGGVAGQLQESATFENVQSNIDVRAARYFVGGIIGLAPTTASFKQCSAYGDVTLTAGIGENSPYRLGGIVGGWADKAETTFTLTDCTFEGKLTSGEITAFDCNNLVGRGYSTIVDAIVNIDNVNYVYKGNSLYLVNTTYEVKNAPGLVALSGMTIKGGESVKLVTDIDLENVEFNGLNAFNPENNNTFDGNGYTVSNWKYEGNASDMGFIKNWVGPIKNVKFENCHLKTNGRSAVVAAKVYGNIESVIVDKCSIEDNYWACGIIAGMYNSGSISDCTVTASSVTSNGGTGGIVGVFNESTGERSLKNCSVSNSTINNTGTYGESYTGGGLVGIFNCDAKFVIENCKVKNNTLKGDYIFEKYPADEEADITEK